MHGPARTVGATAHGCQRAWQTVRGIRQTYDRPLGPEGSLREEGQKRLWADQAAPDQPGDHGEPVFAVTHGLIGAESIPLVWAYNPSKVIARVGTSAKVVL